MKERMEWWDIGILGRKIILIFIALVYHSTIPLFQNYPSSAQHQILLT
jgi:hypothetical protein